MVRVPHRRVEVAVPRAVVCAVRDREDGVEEVVDVPHPQLHRRGPGCAHVVEFQRREEVEGGGVGPVGGHLPKVGVTPGTGIGCGVPKTEFATMKIETTRNLSPGLGGRVGCRPENLHLHRPARDILMFEV